LSTDAANEFEDILFAFTVEAALAGGERAIALAEEATGVEFGRMFHFVDVDALRYLQENAISLSETTAARLTGNLEEAIQAGIREGKPISEVVKDVHSVFTNLKEYEAERIARTEIARGANTGAISGYKEMGIAKAEWYANSGACVECEGMAGNVYPVDEANMIPLHPNCYCFWLPVVGKE